MEIDVKTKVAAYLVDHVFMPQVNVALKKFTAELYETARFQIEYKNLTGYNIGVEKIIVLDLSAPARQLVENLIIAFTPKENKNEIKIVKT